MVVGASSEWVVSSQCKLNWTSGSAQEVDRPGGCEREEEKERGGEMDKNGAENSVKREGKRTSKSSDGAGGPPVVLIDFFPFPFHFFFFLRRFVANSEDPERRWTWGS